MLTLTWVGGEHRFRLRLGELRALQDIANAGPDRVLRRIVSGDWRVDDLLATVRLGLIGAGLDEGEAKRLVLAMAEQHPLLHFQHVAQMVLMDAITGIEDDPLAEDGDAPPEKPEAGGETAVGDSPATTATARS